MMFAQAEKQFFKKVNINSMFISKKVGKSGKYPLIKKKKRQ